MRGVEEGTNFGDYNLFGNKWLEDEFLSLACYALTNTLEDNGWEAVPIFPNPCELAPTGVSVQDGRPAPNVFPDFNYAAVACGLCELGYNNIPLSQKFGSRQRFHMIITDAELPATPLLTESVCNKCKECVRACPLGAISDEFEEIEICGKIMKVAKIDYEKCRTCKNGAVNNRFSNKARPDRIAAVCNRTCMICLEENNRVSNLFENQFRTAPAWSVGGVKEERDAAKVLGGNFSKTGNRGHQK